MTYDDQKRRILAFYSSKKRMPSYAEIMTLVGFKSKNAVYKLAQKLLEEGVLRKDAAGKLLPVVGAGEVPLLGLVEAGIPSEAEEYVLESMNVETYLMPHKEKTFLLEVKGDSMIEAHIEEGDMVVAERAEDARDGEIVVAEVDGEWTLKYLRKDARKGVTWLEPANKRYKPIYPEQGLRIAAVVRGVIRKY